MHGPRARLPGVDVDDLLAVAEAVAEAARGPTLAHFRRPLDVRDKAGGRTDRTVDGTGFDPVTIADGAAEAAMRAVLGARRPDDAVRGEELADVPGSTGLTWVLDPIDGTRSFVAGMPTWGTLVAVGPDTGPVVGVIDQPFLGERFVGVIGVGDDRAWCDGAGTHTTLATRHDRDLGDAVLFTSFPEVGTPAERAAFDRVRTAVRMTRYSADCYAYAMLASGHVDLVVEAGLKPHDVQALVPVVVGAGGVATAWDGGSPRGGGRLLAAATRDLHTAAMELLAG